jgi:hypothetical protein
MKTTIFFLSLFLSLVSQAQTGIQIERINYGGNGCPSGSASTVLTPDASELQILFDAFTADNSHGSLFDQRTCSIMLNVRVPQGYQVIVDTDAAGFAHVEGSAQAQLRQEMTVGSQRLPAITKNFTRTSNDFEISNDLLATRPVWTGCGENTVVRINYQLKSTGRTQALLNLDHLRLRASQWKRCR